MNILKDITRICFHDEVEGFHDALSEVYELANDVQCTYEAQKETERKPNDRTNYNTLKKEILISILLQVLTNSFVRNCLSMNSKRSIYRSF